MPRFVFDTKVLINYIRQSDQEAYDALTVAADLGQVFISQISILELWAPEKWSIPEKSPHLVPLWIRKLEAGEISEGMKEFLIEKLAEYQHPIPNMFIAQTLRSGHRWVISDEGGIPVFLVEYTGEVLVFRPPDIRRNQLEQEFLTLQSLCENLGARIIPVSSLAQNYAETIVKFYRERLGKSVIPDSLIIATGLARRAWLVTGGNEFHRWQWIAKDISKRDLPLPKMKVIDPAQLARKELPK